MCDICVIEGVKRRMISRRDLLRGSTAGAVAAAAAVAAPLPAFAQPAATAHDLTHELTEDFPTFFGEQQFFYSQLFNFAEHNFNLGEIRVNEHTGTHMDAPLHFSADGQSVAEIPVENLIVPLAIVDIRGKAGEDPDAQVTPDDLRAWIEANGPIPERACVAMLSGWAERLGGPGFRNAGEDQAMHFPGFHAEAAAMLLEETDTVGIAVDTLSLDHGPLVTEQSLGHRMPGGSRPAARLGSDAVRGRAQASRRHRGAGAGYRAGLMPTVPLVSDAEASGEVRAVFDDIRATRETDHVNNFWRALAADPGQLAQVWAEVKAVMRPGALDPLTKEMLYLAVSAANGCGYCVHSHTAAARAKGMDRAMYGELLAVIGLAARTNRLAETLQVPVDERFRVE